MPESHLTRTWTFDRGTDEASQIVGNGDLWSGTIENNDAFGSSGIDLLPSGYRGCCDGNSSGNFNGVGVVIIFV